MVKTPADNHNIKTKKEHLAHMIAKALNDTDQINLYLTCCKKYPLSIVHRAFSEAKSVPQEQIRKSRAAIFFYLIKRYAHKDN